jgi:hypothetical protein
MKRALLAAVLLVAVTACGSPGSDSETGPTTATATPTSDTGTTVVPTTTTTTPPPPPPPATVATAAVPVQPAPVQPPPVEPPPVQPPPAAPSAYYENCDAARAAGAAPIHRGEPGYRPGLDRDGDGTACDG